MIKWSVHKLNVTCIQIFNLTTTGCGISLEKPHIIVSLNIHKHHISFKAIS